MRCVRRLGIGLVALAATGCSGSKKQTESVTLATTTSTRDSGLLDVLVPMFRVQTGIEVKVVAVGSGQALGLGRRGDADVLLTHSPEDEDEFMAKGHGEARRTVMFNDFLLVGPKTDPAKVGGESSITEAFRRIALCRAAFVSRGDESGTHRMERRIWRRAGENPRGDWYIEAGAGMAEVLRMASQKGAYTLADRGTYLTQRRNLDLAVAVEKDPLLLNRYSVIVVSPAKHPHVKHEAARRFAEFLVSPGTQATIAEFGVADYGGPLFYPSAGRDVRARP